MDIFNASTPLGVKEFRNIIAYHNKTASKRLVLAAHYDSKYFPVF
jgi:glutaminyl-peptide cyclotransferase